MLRGVQFTIHLSYLGELRAESAVVAIAPPLVPTPLPPLYPNV